MRANPARVALETGAHPSAASGGSAAPGAAQERGQAGHLRIQLVERIRAAIAQGLTGPIDDVGDEEGRVLIAME